MQDIVQIKQLIETQSVRKLTHKKDMTEDHFQTSTETLKTTYDKRNGMKIDPTNAGTYKITYVNDHKRIKLPSLLPCYIKHLKSHVAQFHSITRLKDSYNY